MNKLQVGLYRGSKKISGDSIEVQQKEDNLNICQGKVCSELTQRYLNLDLIRIINNELYMYDDKFGYFKILKEGEATRKLLSLLKEEIKRDSISSKTIEEVVKRLKNMDEINLEYSEINSNPQYINCQNGVLDIIEQKLLPHEKKYLFTYCINANYIDDPEGVEYTKEITKFFNTSLEEDENKRKLLMEVIGYMISDFNNAKKAFIFIGKPHSGKSLLARIISKLIGSENVSNIPFHKLGDRFSNAELSIHKLNINAELDSTPIRRISNFKAIVGNDYLSAEFKGKPLFSFKSRTKLLFCGNYMPEIKDIESSQAFTDRLIFLIFNRSTPKKEIDYRLEEKLINDIDVIFTQSMYALKELVGNNFQFILPKDSQKFLEEYSNNQNHVLEFISECCRLEDGAKVHTKNLYKMYQKFCEQNCIAMYNLTKFSEYISNVNGVYKTRFRLNGMNLRGFEGIAIKEFPWDGTEQ